MKTIAGFAIIVPVLLAIFSIAATVYGIYLAFSASLILGIIVFIVEPTPLILGVLGLLGHPEVASRIATWLGL